MSGEPSSKRTKVESVDNPYLVRPLPCCKNWASRSDLLIPSLTYQAHMKPEIRGYNPNGASSSSHPLHGVVPGKVNAEQARKMMVRPPFIYQHKRRQP